MRKPGFTLIELLSVIAIIGLLIAILMPGLGAVREEANKVKCASNLSNIGKALRLYAGEFDNKLPSMPHSAGAQWRYIGYNRSTDLDWLNPTACKGNTRALYSGLIRSGKLSPDSFICPARGGHTAVRDAEKDTIWDFPADTNISYSYQNIWESKPSLNKREGVPIMADRNPQFVFVADSGAVRATVDPNMANKKDYFAVKDQPLTCNSLNHGGKGQNVLYIGGNVNWCRTPLAGVSISGSKLDNIYTRYRSGSDYGDSPTTDTDALWSQGSGHELDAWLVP